jgi:hypothetical protein
VAQHGAESYFVVGEGRQLGEPTRRKLGVLMAAGGGGTSQVPSDLT